jgi:hypothetical protein
VSALFRLSGVVRGNPVVDSWFLAPDQELRRMVQPWFEALRACGEDVGEVMHDGWPTACVADAAFAYVAAFGAHASLGFFDGADLDDPAGLLEGAGKRMRHVNLRWGSPAPEAALRALIAAAYRDIQARLAAEG